MKALFVGSGSKGNASVFISGDTIIEIDAGLSLKRVHIALGPYGKSRQDLQALFITHNHSDHVSQLHIMMKDMAKVYAGEFAIDEEGYTTIEPGVGVDIGPFNIIPFSSHHDAPNPLNFILLVEGMKIGYVTDTGYIDDLGLAMLSNCDYYVFESNYEPSLLEASSRPAWLKQRIRGKTGHLSNKQCGQYLKKLIGDKTKTVFLAHLSEECNTEMDALNSAHNAISKIKNKRKDLKVICLKQHEAVEADLLP